MHAHAPDAHPSVLSSDIPRPVAVHLTVGSVEPDALAGSICIVIDNLRACVTMTTALVNGAVAIIPALTVEEALTARATLRASPPPLLGGERAGLLIDGFDLDNSPRAYTPARVAGRTIIFTTTNGTAALRRAHLAAEIYLGSFVNLRALAEKLAPDPRPIHILCAGTGGQVSLDDCLPAGRLAELLLTHNRQLVNDDSARLCIAAWHSITAPASSSTSNTQAPPSADTPDALQSRLLHAMHHSRGGRALIRLGLQDDLPPCCALDSLPALPRLNPATGHIHLT